MSEPQKITKPHETATKEPPQSYNMETLPTLQQALVQVRSAAAVPPPTKSVLALQRWIGNRQTGQLLQRRMIQREGDTPTGDAPAGNAPAANTPPTVDLEKIFNRLYAGDYALQGQYQETEVEIPDSDKKKKVFERFVNDDLHLVWTMYMAWWAPNVPMKATLAKAGDSGGKAADHPQWVVEFQQKLMGQFEKGDKRLATPYKKPKKGEEAQAEPPPALKMWDRASEGAQRLLEAYLNAWSVQTASGGANQRSASGVEEFIHNIGASQTNNQAILMGGYRNSNDWCAVSSGRAAALGLMRRGIRFKGTNPVAITPKNGALGALLADLNTQAVRINTWGGDFESKATNPKQKEKEQATVRKTAEDAGRAEKSSAVPGARLKAGDRITAIFGGMTGPISGHVATVVKEDLLPGIDEKTMGSLPENTPVSTVTIVSGNAAGVEEHESSIRMESFTRIITPASYPDLNGKMVGAANKYQYTLIPAFRAAERESRAKPDDEALKTTLTQKKKDLDDFKKTSEYPVSRDDPKFKLGLHAPKQGGEGWIIAIMRTSLLDANALIDKDGKPKMDDLEKQGLVVFDEESLTKPNAGLNKLYPGALALFE